MDRKKQTSLKWNGPRRRKIYYRRIQSNRQTQRLQLFFHPADRQTELCFISGAMTFKQISAPNFSNGIKMKVLVLRHCVDQGSVDKDEKIMAGYHLQKGNSKNTHKETETTEIERKIDRQKRNSQKMMHHSLVVLIITQFVSPLRRDGQRELAIKSSILQKLHLNTNVFEMNKCQICLLALPSLLPSHSL